MMRPLTSLAAALLIALPAGAAETAATEMRLEEIVRRGAQVMPFALTQTTHVFSKTGNGGIQQVIAKAPDNTRQINLIRLHLSKISRQFAQGDFSAPEKIHGKTMPGLGVLRNARPGEIVIAYSELADGAQLVYTTENPALVHALHQWFDAQLSDHARHAVPGHAGHRMHGQ